MEFESGNGKDKHLNPDEHFCFKSDKIDNLDERMDRVDHAIFGNAKPGFITIIPLMDEKLNSIISNQKKLAVEIKERQNNIAGWVKSTVAIFVTLLGIGVIMFIKIEKFPYEYVAKAQFNQWADELREQTKIFQNIALDVSVGKLDSLAFYRKQVEILQSRESLFNQMRATRGGKPGPPTKADSLFREKTIKDLEERYKK
jgi:hypothetical protein